MTAIVIEHVPITDLPAAWQQQLGHAAGSCVSVRIEAEREPGPPAAVHLGDNPQFGMWRGREDLAEVPGFMQGLRAPRFNGNGPGNER